MTKIDAIKDLLRINLDAFNDAINSTLFIKFDGDDFYIHDNYKKEIFKGKILKYGLDLDGQKRFIVDVGNKLYPFFKENSSIFGDTIGHNSKKGLYKILGNNNYLFDEYKIKIEKEKLKLCEELGDKINDKMYKKCLETFMDTIGDELDSLKFDVIYDAKNECLYINRAMDEALILVNYVEDVESIEGNNSVLNLLENKFLLVFFSATTDEELNSAIKFIKSFFK